MNKLLLSTALVLGTCSMAFSQGSSFQGIKPIDRKTVSTVKPLPSAAVIETSSERAGVIYSNDFSNAQTWSITMGAGAVAPSSWTIGTAVPSGSYPIAAITSTTAANGYALFDSDLMCSMNQIGNLTTAAPFSTVGHTAVLLKFQQHYRKWNSKTYVQVSSDGVNFTNFEVNANFANNQSSTNGEVITLNISNVAANKSSVWVRFQYYSPTSGCDYSWMVDDLSIEDAPSDNIALERVFYGKNNMIPVSQVTPISLSGKIKNIGGALQNGVHLKATVNNGFMSTSTPKDLAPTMVDSAVIASQLNLSTLGVYDINFEAKQNQMDSEPINNTKIAKIAVTDSTFGRDNGIIADYVFYGTKYEPANIFNVANQINATSASFAVYSAPVGAQVVVNLVDINDTTGAVLATSEVVTVQASDLPTTLNQPSVFVTARFAGNVELMPGAYAVIVSPVNPMDSVIIAAGSPFTGAYVIDNTTGTWYTISKVPQIRLNVNAGVQCPQIMSTTSVVDASCNQANGSIMVTSTGGVSPYSYQWMGTANGSTGSELTGLTTGGYYAYVYDANGCTGMVQAYVGNTNPPAVPQNRKSYYITGTEAYVKWDGDSSAAFYKVRWRVKGTTTWSYAQTQNTFKKLTGLTAATQYEWSVRAFSTPSCALNWSLNEMFYTTGGVCPSVTGLQVPEVMSTSAMLKFYRPAGGAHHFAIKIRKQGQAWPTTATYTTTENIVMANNLTPGTVYEWCVKSFCNATGDPVSDWKMGPKFTTSTAKTTGIEEITVSSINFYPNPVSNMINVVLGDDALTTINVMDLSGKVLMTRTEAGAANEIVTFDVTDFAAGMYLIRTTNENGVKTEKFMISK